MKMFLWVLLTLGMVSPAHADDVLPPPGDNRHGADISQEIIEPDLKATNLREDLTAEEAIDVRSYSQDNGDKVTEYSLNGRVYMIRIQPIADLPAYYLYDNDGDGRFERRLPGGYKGVSPPMWVIKKF